MSNPQYRFIHTYSKKVILLVEDEALIAMNEAAMLKKNGYEVLAAYNAQKAMDTVAEEEVDLVLMDIDLGEGKMDGTEAAEIILQEKDVPIVFLSSHTEPEVVEKTEGITSYGYIVKNSGETVLLASIRMAFRLYEAHIELKRQKENHNEREELYRNLMENSIDGVELLDEEGRFLNVNKRECEMTGYSREELLQMSIADIDPNYPADGFYRFWNEKPKSSSFLFETLHRHKNGTLIPVEVNGIFFKVNNKKFIYGVVRDITERKQAEKEIKEREENLRTTLHSIRDAVIAADRQGRITQMNPVAARLCGCTKEEALGKKLEEVFTIVNADTRECVDNPFEKVIRTGEIVGLANHTVLISKNGNEYQIADSASPIKGENGEATGVVLVFRDVTEQYEKDRELEDKLHSIEWMLSNKTTGGKEYIPEYGDVSSLNKDGLILTSVEKDRLKDIASEYLDLLETSTAIYEKNGDYALGIFSSGWCRLMDSASRKLCGTEDNQQALKSGKWLCHESCWRDASLAINENRPVEIECNGGIHMYAVPILVNGRTVGAINFGYGSPPTEESKLKVLSQKYKISISELKKQATAYNPRPQFIIDYAKERIQIAAKNLGNIIEHKLSEESLEKERIFLSTVLDTIEDSVVICDKDGNITRFNTSARLLHGLPEKPISSGQWAEYYDLYTPDGTTPLPEADIPLYRAYKGEQVNNAEIVIKPKNRVPRLLSCSGRQIIDAAGETVGAVIVMHDITEYKQVERNLRDALTEKNCLMRELNHRIKNNLNMVSSLVSLKNSETEEDLSDLKNRIETIKLIHEKLHQDVDIERIEIREYFQELLESIFSFSAKRDVRIVNNIEAVSIHTNTAIPLGLVVNEIATNAIKYGFTSDKEARFTIEMTGDSDNKQYILTLSNTGNPFPEKIGLEHPETMGLQLISTLVEQLNGTIKLDKKPNPVFTICFPIEAV